MCIGLSRWFRSVFVCPQEREEREEIEKELRSAQSGDSLNLSSSSPRADGTSSSDGGGGAQNNNLVASSASAAAAAAVTSLASLTSALKGEPPQVRSWSPNLEEMRVYITP